jgi:hypothetical protein
MKRFKRMTCFLVAALMLMSVFTACGSQAKQDPAASSTAEQTTTAVDPQQEAALDTSPITLKVYAKYAWWGRKGDNLTQSLTGMSSLLQREMKNRQNSMSCFLPVTIRI